ncbi:hypothetical protein G0U57_008904, partial [Chelydra serpentina]
MDFIDLLPTIKEGYKYLLVVIDVFSAWTEAFPTRVNTASMAARKLYEEIFCWYGTPRIIVSDQGGAFVGEVLKSLLAALNIKQQINISYRPQSSATVERQNQNLKNALRKMCSASGTDWPTKLPTILAALRNSNR